MCADLIWPQAWVWGGEVHWEALGPGVEAVCLAPALAPPTLVARLPVEVLVPVAPRGLGRTVQPGPGLGAAVEAGRVIAGGGGGEPGGQGEILRWNRNRRLDLGDYPLQNLKLLCIYISGYNRTFWCWN